MGEADIPKIRGGAWGFVIFTHLTWKWYVRIPGRSCQATMRFGFTPQWRSGTPIGYSHALDSGMRWYKTVRSWQVMWDGCLGDGLACDAYAQPWFWNWENLPRPTQHQAKIKVSSLFDSKSLPRFSKKKRACLTVTLWRNIMYSPFNK